MAGFLNKIVSAIKDELKIEEIVEPSENVTIAQNEQKDITAQAAERRQQAEEQRRIAKEEKEKAIKELYEKIIKELHDTCDNPLFVTGIESILTNISDGEINQYTFCVDIATELVKNNADTRESNTVLISDILAFNYFSELPSCKAPTTEDEIKNILFPAVEEFINLDLVKFLARNTYPIYGEDCLCALYHVFRKGLAEASDEWLYTEKIYEKRDQSQHSFGIDFMALAKKHYEKKYIDKLGEDVYRLATAIINQLDYIKAKSIYEDLFLRDEAHLEITEDYDAFNKLYRKFAWLGQGYASHILDNDKWAFLNRLSLNDNLLDPDEVVIALDHIDQDNFDAEKEIINYMWDEIENSFDSFAINKHGIKLFALDYVANLTSYLTKELSNNFIKTHFKEDFSLSNEEFIQFVRDFLNKDKEDSNPILYYLQNVKYNPTDFKLNKNSVENPIVKWICEGKLSYKDPLLYDTELFLNNINTPEVPLKKIAEENYIDF